jgi:predicted RNA-binding protein YlxR (DUF448 family)
MAAKGCGRAPVLRTCIACRSVLPKVKLLRVALKEGRPRLDVNNRASGRGAYICANTECLQKAGTKKGAFERAFRQSFPRESLVDLFAEISDKLHAREGRDSVVDYKLKMQDERNN